MEITKHELEQLFQNAAVSIVGKRVKVHLQAPPTSDFDGEYYTINGEPHIDISPKLDDSAMLYVLCHEIGHALEHTGAEYSARTYPKSSSLTEYGKYLRENSLAVAKIEYEAEMSAQRLLAYVEEHYKEYGGITMLERKLRCLAGYLPYEQRKRGAKIATRAASEEVKLYLWKQKQLKLCGVKR